MNPLSNVAFNLNLRRYVKGLQDRMEPFPTDEAMLIMREELGLESGAAAGAYTRPLLSST
jgi:hypothetical protein